MNKRAIAILLALLLCLPCACLANGEEAAEPSGKVQAEEAQKAAPQSASSERAEEAARANASASSARESGDAASAQAKSFAAKGAGAEESAESTDSAAKEASPKAANVDEGPASEPDGKPAPESGGAAAAKAGVDIAAEDSAAESSGAENVAEQPNIAAGEPSVENNSPEDADTGEDSPEPESGGEPAPESGDAEVEGEHDGDGDLPDADDPTAEPSPESTPDPDATPEPDATQTPDASPDPDTTPEPDTGLRVSVEGATQLEDGSWQIPFSAQEDKLRFSWTAVEGATGYAWEIVDAEGKSVASGSQTETALELAAKDYLTGRFTLVVRAEPPEGAEPQEARYTFELKQAEQPGEEQPDKRPSGGFGGGSRPSGGTSSASGGGAAQGEVGLQITPGKALTSDHASGSKDMTAYGAVALSIGDATQTQLTLGDMELGVSRSDGGSFTAKIADGALRLSAEDGAEWSVNALALEVLARSGLDELTLISGGQSLTLPTTLTLSGPIYASYRAQGYVSKDFELRASPAGVAVYVNGECYALNADGMIMQE